MLGRGELYQVFIDLAQHMLKTPPSAVTEHGIKTLFLKTMKLPYSNSSFPLHNFSESATYVSDVNVAFQQAAHKVLLDDDNLLPLLHLTIDYQGKESKGIAY